MDKFEELRIKNEAQKKATDMLLSMMEAIMPDDMQPIVQLPKLVNQIDHKTSAILKMVSHTADFEDSVNLASEANILLSRVDEALDAFIEQHNEVGVSE